MADTATVTPVPKTWPGAFGLFKYSRSAIGYNIWTLILLFLIAIVVGVAIDSIFATTRTVDYGSFYNSTQYGSTEIRQTSPIGNLLSFVVSSILTVSVYLVTFAGIARQKMSLGQSFKGLKPMVVLKYIGLEIVLTVIATLTLIALVVPFFIIMPRLMLSAFYVVDGEMGIGDALKASWNNTKGNVGKVYAIFGVNLLFILLCVTIIGIPVAIYLVIAYGAAYPLLYKYLTANK